jgi:hypothetical protein
MERSKYYYAEFGNTNEHNDYLQKIELYFYRISFFFFLSSSSSPFLYFLL